MMEKESPYDGAKAWCHVMYALHTISAVSGVLSSATIVSAFIFGWPSIIAVVINFATRKQAEGSWLASHYQWQMRTFWVALLWLLVAGLLVITLIGIPAAVLVMFVAGIWVLYRMLRGWLALANRQALSLA
jgi:uncharacterized membrane protein